MQEKEISYVMIKPGFADNGDVISEIRNRICEDGLEIVDARYVHYDRKAARKHYKEHLGKGFYKELESYIISGKAYGMVVEGDNVIARIRQLVQKDKAVGLQKGDIRYDIPHMFGFPIDMTKNVIHASDSLDSAEREIKIFRDLVKANKDVHNATYDEGRRK